MVRLNERNGIAFESAQVRREVKQALCHWLCNVGVSGVSPDPSESSVLFHCYYGERVCISLKGETDIEAWNKARDKAVSMYWRNKQIDEGCFHVHQNWVDDLFQYYSF